MASEQQDKIRSTEDVLYIEDFQIHDRDIASYFQNLNESERKKKLLDLIKIGISVTKSMGTSKNIDYVEKAFDNLNSDFAQKLERVFGERGQFPEVVKKHFGEDGKVIKELFNPNHEGSPLYILRKDLNENLDKIREKIGENEAERKAIKETEERGTKKGLDFEEQCAEKLRWIAKIHSDKLDESGTTKGNKLDSKKGDFVLTVTDIGKKIVFEMKNKGSISEKDIHKELKESMENREADYGIFVAKNKNSLPDTVGWFNEYDGNHLVCAVENDGEEIMDGEIIHIAYKWARAKLRTESTKEKKFDAELILAKTSEIRRKIEDLRKIKMQCTNINKSTEDIEKVTKNTEKEIKAQLEEIVDNLEG